MEARTPGLGGLPIGPMFEYSERVIAETDPRRTPRGDGRELSARRPIAAPLKRALGSRAGRRALVAATCLGYALGAEAVHADGPKAPGVATTAQRETVGREASGAAEGSSEEAGTEDRSNDSRPTAGDPPRHIAAYHGYANAQRLWVSGRLLEQAPAGRPSTDDSWRDNLKASFQRWESDEVPGALVRLHYAGEVRSVETDAEGYYRAEFARAGGASSSHVVTAEHALGDRTLTASHPIAALDDGARFVVISDMDDTVIETGLTNLLRSAKRTFLDNAETREPLPGVGRLYRALARGEADRPVNPVLYLSDSTWNLYDLLRDFLRLNQLPEGPLLLRDLGIGSDTSDHKTASLGTLLERFAPLPVVLLGDSGQHDAEVYSQVAAEHPDRIKAIYIRDVDPDESSDHDREVDTIIEQSRKLGVPFVRVRDSVELARHAIALGLFSPSHLAEIASSAEADRRR